MHTPKSQHYLPRFYLSRWADQGGKVTCFFIRNNKVINSRVAPKNTGFETDIYTLHTKNGKNKYIIENCLSRFFDNEAAPVIKKLVDGTTISCLERSIFTRYIIAQRLRTPHVVDHLRKHAKEKILEIAIEVGSLSENRSIKFVGIEAASENLFGKVFLNLTIKKDIGDIIFDMIWMTHEIQTDEIDLLTSDYPVIISGNLKHPDAKMFFPLSPRHLLVASKYPHIVTNEKQLIRDINKVLVRQTKFRIWATGTQHQPLIEKWLTKSPGSLTSIAA